MAEDLRSWLERECAAYRFEGLGIYQALSTAASWPVHASNAEELTAALERGGHLLPLPKEPAALANILEVSIVDALVAAASRVPDAVVQRGSERHYPDLEISGSAFGSKFHAVDIKVARRGIGARGPTGSTQSRITLYTGNTYFRYPSLKWPGTFRPFADYSSHLDVLCIYTLDAARAARVTDLQLIVQEPWRIASRQRSSTTREYLGAVQKIADLSAGRGEFSSPSEFYAFWRKYPFKIGRVVQKQLDRALAEAGELRIFHD